MEATVGQRRRTVVEAEDFVCLPIFDDTPENSDRTLDSRANQLLRFIDRKVEGRGGMFNCVNIFDSFVKRAILSFQFRKEINQHVPTKHVKNASPYLFNVLYDGIREFARVLGLEEVFDVVAF